MIKQEEIIKEMGIKEIFMKLMVLYDHSASFRKAVKDMINEVKND